MAFAHNAEAAERGFHSFFGLSARAKSTTVLDATDARRVHPAREGARRSPEWQTARPAVLIARGEVQGSGPGARCASWVTKDELELEIYRVHAGASPGVDEHHVHVRFAAWEFEVRIAYISRVNTDAGGRHNVGGGSGIR